MQVLRQIIGLRLADQSRAAAACGLQHAAAFAKEASAPSSSKAKSRPDGDSKIQEFLKALEPQEVVEIELSPEDLAEAERRAKEYSRLKMRRHREWQAALTAKLKLKQAAVAALPDDLRAAALVPDLEPFPANRQIFTETPPVEVKADAGADKQQTRSKRSIGTKRR